MTKILLVEDDKSLREIYGVRLLAEGYDIVSAGDGEEALAMAIKEKPTLIISDVMMPKISGFDMLDILRSTTETRDIRVIMMTALSSDDQRIRGEQLGADRYLVKSQVGIEDVVRTVHEILQDSSSATDTTPAPAAEPVATPAPEPTQSSTEPEVAAVPEPTPAFATVAPQVPVAVTPVSVPEQTTPGPLPPQPSEDVSESTESVLPQPTAPFSSPRPTNLGERVIHPLEDHEEQSTIVTPEISEQIAKELEAAAEPVTNSQVDEFADAAPVTSEATTPSDQAFDTAASPETPATPQYPEAPAAAPQFSPATPTTDDKPPTITPPASPIS